MRSTEANCPMAQVRVFSSGFGSGETEEEKRELHLEDWEPAGPGQVLGGLWKLNEF